MSADYVKKVFNQKYMAEIVEDDMDNEESPRDWENLGIMLCYTKRYDLGDDKTVTRSDFNSWEGLEEILFEREKALVVLPLYLLDHSGLSISTSDFRYCDAGGWDSGQIGFIYTTARQYRSICDKNKIEFSQDDLNEIKQQLITEVNTYDEYLRGEVYGYRLYPINDDGTPSEDETDSCYGFYGMDNIEQEVRDMMEIEEYGEPIQDK